MPDRKKVLKGLQHCTAWAGLHECQPKVGDDCPYVDEADCKLTIMRDALELLKEQEEQLSIKTENFNRLIAKISVMPKIVQCKDCKHHLGCDDWIVNGDDWFCGDGERL